MIEPIKKHLNNQKYLEAHVEWRNSALPWTRENDKTTYREQFKFFSNLMRNKEYFVVLDGAKPVGTTGLTGISKTHGTAEFSLLIGPEFRKRGYGTQALKDILNYGFNELKLQMIYGETFIYPYRAKEYLDKNNIQYVENDYGLINPGALAYEKLGFKLDAHLPNRFNKFGFKVSSVIYSIEHDSIR